MEFLTLADIAKLPPETAENAYRRGYRDGYIASMYDAFPREVPKKFWNFWQFDLSDWLKDDPTNRFKFPPRFGNKKRKTTRLFAFWSWLYNQKERDDIVGDLASDSIRHKENNPETHTIPLASNSKKVWKEYFEPKGSHVVEAFEIAYREFENAA